MMTSQILGMDDLDDLSKNHMSNDSGSERAQPAPPKLPCR